MAELDGRRRLLYGKGVSIILNPELERIVNEEVKAGHYQTVDEVLARALQILRAQDAWVEENRAGISEKISRGLAQLDRGEGVTGEEARRRLEAMKAVRPTRAPG